MTVATLPDIHPVVRSKSLERLLPIYISNYFKDKNIPNDVDLVSSKYIDLCINTNICDGADMAYKALERSGRFDSTSSDHSISEDIRFVIRILSQMKRHVPQEFSAGVLLMHLELVEGIPFLTET